MSQLDGAGRVTALLAYLCYHPFGVTVALPACAEPDAAWAALDAVSGPDWLTHPPTLSLSGQVEYWTARPANAQVST